MKSNNYLIFLALLLAVAIACGKKTPSEPVLNTPTFTRTVVINAPTRTSTQQPATSPTITATMTVFVTPTVTITLTPLTTGITWTMASTSAGFGERYHHNVIEYNGKMWLIAGASTSGHMKDVWNSTDGVDWTFVTGNAAFGPREGQSAIVYQNKMWVLGGNSNGTRKNDVWSSTDGAVWILEAANGGFTAMNSFTLNEYLNANGRFWIVGGCTSDSDFRPQIWKSDDLKSWTLASATSAIGQVREHIAYVYDGKLWVVGGGIAMAAPADTNKVFNTTDGINWTMVASNPAFSVRRILSGTIFSNKMWVIGGLSGSTEPRDVWCSSDGITWTKQSNDVWGSHIRGSVCLTFVDRMWLVGVPGSTKIYWTE